MKIKRFQWDTCVVRVKAVQTFINTCSVSSRESLNKVSSVSSERPFCKLGSLLQQMTGYFKFPAYTGLSDKDVGASISFQTPDMDIRGLGFRNFDSCSSSAKGRLL